MAMVATSGKQDTAIKPNGSCRCHANSQFQSVSRRRTNPQQTFAVVSSLGCYFYCMIRHLLPERSGRSNLQAVSIRGKSFEEKVFCPCHLKEWDSRFEEKLCDRIKGHQSDEIQLSGQSTALQPRKLFRNNEVATLSADQVKEWEMDLGRSDVVGVFHISEVMERWPLSR